MSVLFSCICFLIRTYLRFVALTSRYRYLYVGHRFDGVAASPTKSSILVLWHEHAASSLLTHRWQQIRPLVSHSKDGELVVRTFAPLGFSFVRGSSSRGAAAARHEMLDHVLAGSTVALTVDGPRGPRHVPKMGCIDLAAQSGAPIIPLCSLSDRAWVLKKTWDQTKIPKPFSRILVCYGEPILVPKGVSKENYPMYQERVTESLLAWEKQTRDSFEACWKLGIPKIDESP